MISVVIPYFQRQHGVLRKALASIASQQGVESPIDVIIIDDESPASAEPEVSAIAWSPERKVRIHRQRNAGPGSARNAALGLIDASCQFVAFLDSDDEWHPQHLARAVAALEADTDLYFADHLQLGQSVSAFERGKRLRLDDHTPIEGTWPGLYRYSGDLFNQILIGNVIGTSTVVYRYRKFSPLRFRTEFTTAGEDYLFWMELCKAGARASFSVQVDAVYGKGVNVYSGSGWGTEGHLLRVHQEIAYRLSTKALFDLNPNQRSHVDGELQRLRDSFWRDLFHRARRRQGGLHLLRRHIKMDPALVAALPGVLWRLATKK